MLLSKFRTPFQGRASATILGFLSILFFSSSIGVFRPLSEQLGPITAIAVSATLSGVLLCMYWHVCGKKPLRTKDMPRKYLLWCGLLFVANMTGMFLAVGLAVNRQQVVIAGLINYLWCSLALVFSVPILKKRAGPYVVMGCLLAFSGIVIAGLQNESSISLGSLYNTCKINSLPYLLAFMAAFSWALYSNLCSKWASSVGDGSMPIFLLASGLILIVIRFFVPEQSHWNLSVIPQIMYMALIPLILAYVFWDEAMRRGNATIVMAFSNFIPVLSTLVSCFCLHITPSYKILIAALMVLCGAFICKESISDPSSSSQGRSIIPDGKAVCDGHPD